MEFGPDGALYVLEYGDGYFAENPDAQLSKINFVRGNRTPIVKVAANPAGGAAPLTVAVLARAGTTDPDGDKLSFAWDFDGDGKVDIARSEPDVTRSPGNGEYRPDAEGDRQDRAHASADVPVLVGNQPPVVELDHDTEAGRSGGAVPVRSRRHLRGHDHRRPAGRLLQGHRGLRPRPRAARPPAVLDGGLHGHVHEPLDTGHAGAANLSAIFGAPTPTPAASPASTAPSRCGSRRRRLRTAAT